MTPTAAATGDYRRAAWSWTQHLRRAGSTPWAAWTPPDPGAPVPDDWSVPGAAQLELVRRLAEPGQLAPDLFTALADLVLSRSGPGRGLAQQPLSWPAPGVGPGFGAPPVDPSDVPVEELLRAGAGTLTELLLAARPGAAEHPTTRRPLLTRAPAFALAGAPVSTSAVRHALATAGQVEGGRVSRVAVVAEPVDEALAQVWSGRVQAGAPVRWQGFVRRWAGRRVLPPSADLPAVARHWAQRVGVDRVHVVVGTLGSDTTAGRVGAALGLSTSRPTRAAGHPRVLDLSPAAVDVVRRVNAVLNVRAPDDRRVTLRRLLVASLASSACLPGSTLTVPAPFQPWARERAARVVEELTSGGYPVHGRLGDTVPTFEGPTHPRRRDALDLVVDACLARARLNRDPAPEGGQT